MKQEIYYNDSYSSLESIIHENNFTKVLIVCGKRIKDSIFNNYNDKYIFFNNYDYNPKLEDVEKLVTLIYEINPQIVVAIGGGTAIDLAKQACLLSRIKKESVKNQITTNSYKSIDNVIPLIAIPTTAGTGSESTKFAVIYIDGIKHSVEHNLMIPKYIILDPNLLSGCPKQIIASTAMDSLTQAIESIWSVHSTSKSIEYASQAIQLINENIIKGYETQYRDKNVALNMINAANLSGNAINIAKTTAPHAISYPITIYNNIPHGHAVGMIMTKFFQ